MQCSYNIEKKNNDLHIKGIHNLSLPMTLDCGQAFRWSSDDGKLWKGIAYNKYLELYIDNDTLVLLNTTEEDFNNIWKRYFDLERDYQKIINSISENEILKSASSYGSGIRLLNQEPWETLCSFIISQNFRINDFSSLLL